MINAFIFDMDGTLLDTEIIWVESIEAFLRERGFALTHEEGLKLVYGRSWHDIHADMMRQYQGLDLNIEETSQLLRPHFLRLRDIRDIRIHPSINLLKKLAEDYPVCIVSGSGTQEVSEGITLMGVESQVDFFLAADHYSPGKPDPTCFLMAADKLDRAPANCLVFEDSTAGVQAAKNAGMFCVALAQKGRPAQDLSDANLVLDNLGQFSLPEFWNSVKD